MATCENGALNCIYEIIEIAGGLSVPKEYIVTSTSKCAPRLSICAFATSRGDIFLFCHKNGKSTTKIIPWSIDDSHNCKPAALAFSPTLEWLLVANEDGSICIVPVGKFIDGINSECDYRFPTDDVVLMLTNGSRSKPTSIVWWQTLTGEASLAIVGTELGELCFIELSSGKDVGGTYITVPVRKLRLCTDNSLDTVYLLITGTEDRQWRLVLEQKSSTYMFPLDNITPEWGIEEDTFLGSPLAPCVAPSPRSRLLGLKQLSVEKLQLLKQRLSEAKHSSKKKPMTENKGVDTCDIDELPSPNTTIITPQKCSDPQQSLGKPQTSASPSAKKVISPGVDALNIYDESENPNIVNTRPERLDKYISDVVATPHYAKERYLLGGHNKAKSCLMVYSTDLENTPLYVYKLPQDTDQIVLHDELIFVNSRSHPSKISIVSTFFSASSKIDGEIDSKINPLLQEIYLPEDEKILHIFPAPALVENLLNDGDDSDDESISDYDIELPSSTKPNGCIIITESTMYFCQARKSIENLFMELTLRTGDIEAAHKLGVIFSLDPFLFEIAADAKLKNRNFVSSLALYKHSRCPHVKCSLKFAWAGFVPEFLTYMSSLMNGSGGPDLTSDQRKYLATLALIAHIHQLSLPIGVRTLQQQQLTLKTLLLLLRNNSHYDDIFILIIAAATWRWETLQYLASSRGLLLEKLHALLSQKYSPVSGAPMCRENENGFLHCISDPELQSVLLLKPNLARGHMSFVIDHLSSFNVSILRRLSSLYDPTRAPIAPFFSSSAYFHKPDIYVTQRLNPQPSFLPPANDDPIGLDTLTHVFLAILIKLNEKRGWKYSPNLLSLSTIEPTQKESFFDCYIPRKSLACGYGHSVISLGVSVFSWGIWDPAALGHGVKSSTSKSILQGIDSSLLEELKELTSLLNPPSDVIFSSNEATPPDSNGDREHCKPKVVSYLANMKVYQISSGKHHTLAITDFGVYGWGSSKHGQLGTGSTGKYPRPTLLNSLIDTNVINVSCGQFHSLAVTLDGRLLTWGWNVHGQLGHKTIEDCHKPTPVKYFSKIKIVQAYGGYAHSVSLSSKGVVYAWGCSTYGQIGIGDIQKVLTPTRVVINHFVTHLTAGYFHNVAVTSDHLVYVWGSNPACLRVQAQLQRKNRHQRMQEMEEQKKEEEYKSDLDSKESVQSSVIDQSSPDSDIKAEDPLPMKEVLKVDDVKCPSSPRLVSANTVPSCDPLDLGHLLPKEVEMPSGYGKVKAIAAGSEHTLLLTTHGSLYAWGRNLSGQLGVGSRKESLTPIRILDETHIVEIAAGANFNLALESQGKLWGWGSNYYAQLGLGSGEDQVQADRMFMLRTSRRVVKVPHSIQSNIETPRVVSNLPIVPQSSTNGNVTSSNKQVDLNSARILGGVELSSLEPNSLESGDQPTLEDADDLKYGPFTLHSCLALLHPHYTAKNVIQMLTDCDAHQALATLYALERHHSKAMHHQLCALLSHPWSEDQSSGQKIVEDSEVKQEKSYSTRHVDEAVRILDYYLHLQTEESQSGMRGVLQEGIGLWLTHSLPIPQLEDLLLTHLPRTVYPLALLLFGEEASTCDKERNVEAKDTIEEATTKVLSRLSTKFCLNLCSSVITHLQSGDSSEEQLDALTQMIQTSLGKDAIAVEGEKGPYNDLVETLEENDVNVINLSTEEVKILKEKSEEMDLQSTASGGAKPKETADPKDTVLFTCGHHYTAEDFTAKVLPQLEKRVTTVPGLLGKTARVLLDQYHSDHPQMACPHCVLAHLTIKLTKHNQEDT